MNESGKRTYQETEFNEPEPDQDPEPEYVPTCGIECSHGGDCSREYGHSGNHESRGIGDQVLCSWNTDPVRKYHSIDCARINGREYPCDCGLEPGTEPEPSEWNDSQLREFHDSDWEREDSRERDPDQELEREIEEFENGWERKLERSFETQSERNERNAIRETENRERAESESLGNPEHEPEGNPTVSEILPIAKRNAKRIELGTLESSERFDCCGNLIPVPNESGIPVYCETCGSIVVRAIDPEREG